jgi:serine/threonine protein phosphatase 1
MSNGLFQKITEDYRRTIVVGDVHGCFAELTQLLAKVDFSEEDLLISVGDMVDRGPGSMETARFFRDAPNAMAVLGNHERKLSGAMKGTIQPAWSQMHTMTAIPDHEYGQWVEYFDSLPAVMETPHTIITHARLDPAVSLPEQDPYHTCAVGGPGVVIPLDDCDVPLWYWEWRRTSGIRKPLCIGHLRYPRIALAPGGLFALDTGVAKGGALSAVIFPAMDIVQVASGINHSQMSHDL